MKRPIAIDLGTSNSVVAIPEARAGKGYLTVPQCPNCSVITDRFARPFVPSVVAEDASGAAVVGYLAKARVGQTPPPIMFVKRFMGGDKTFQLDKMGELLPENVSSQILRHLKAMAEDVLGEKVTEAVITVPAYFSLRAKLMTEKAAELAGLKVAQIAQEPVAAALMYCATDPRDPLRIMTYDLGGGTFDVAILQKRDGVITSDSILSFDGDRFLGGYNFDKTLALWIMDQLVAKGYDLQLSPDAPADAPAFAKLMIIAETAKIKLSKTEVYVIEEPSSGIIDHSGNPVEISGLEISRQQFEDMVSTEIEYTIQICRRAIAAACENLNKTSRMEEVTPENLLDEIVMVGGSSRIPKVARRLEEEFGRTPKLVEPDLAVALGAAILAGGLGGIQGCFKLPNIPAETNMNPFMISGQLVVGDGLSKVAGCTVKLVTEDGSYNRTRTVNPDGGFSFENIELLEDDVTNFTLSARSEDGRDLSTHRFTIRHTVNLQNLGITDFRPVTNVLAKPINVMFASGSYEVAPARTPLPFETNVPAKRVTISKDIRIPILEDQNPLGEIIIRDVPDSLPIGSEVEIRLSISQDYRIRGEAYVPALSRTEPVEIQLPVPITRSLEELRRDYELLSERVEAELQAAGPNVVFEKGKRLKDALRHANGLLGQEEREADASRIQDCLEEVETLLRGIEGSWKPIPPREEFETKAKEVVGLIKRVISERPETQKDGYEDQLVSIRKEAEEAYAGQNSAAWRECYKRLIDLEDTIKQIGLPSPPPPSPAELLIRLAQALSQLRKRAEANGHLKDLNDQFDEAAATLKTIDPRASDAMIQIRDWYTSKYEPLDEATTGQLPDPEKKDLLDPVKRTAATNRPGSSGVGRP